MITQPLQVLFACGTGGLTVDALLAPAGRSGVTVPVHVEGITESRRITAAWLTYQVATSSTYERAGD